MRRWFVVLVIGGAACGAWGTASAEAALPGWAYGAGDKLTRGLMGIATGWLELPNQIVDTSQQRNVFVGITWGALKGAGQGLLREAVGVYETVSFLVPVPANYAPLLYPVYAFEPPPPPP